VTVQEDHDLADHLLLGPGGRDAAGSHLTDAVHLLQAIRLCLDDIEHLVAEGAQELLGSGLLPTPTPPLNWITTMPNTAELFDTENIKSKTKSHQLSSSWTLALIVPAALVLHHGVVLRE
jgi:hypothetical protein